MSLVDQLHAAHKERMARLSPPARGEEAFKQLTEEIARLKNQNRELNMALARERFIVAEQKKYIGKLAGVASTATPKLEEILSSVCKYYGVSPEEMRGQGRARPLAHIRQVYYYLCREHSHSLTQTGLYVRKDHSSVLHGARKIKADLQTDLQLETDIRELQQKIGAKVYERQKALEKYMEGGIAA
jgi:chromosomal replication initiation ATPase DnaA